jgi:hypothetical protein
MRISSSILWSAVGLWSADWNARLLLSATLGPCPMGVTVDFCCAPCFADVVLRGLDDFVAILFFLLPQLRKCSFYKRERRCFYYRRILGSLRTGHEQKFEDSSADPNGPMEGLRVSHHPCGPLLVKAEQSCAALDTAKVFESDFAGVTTRLWRSDLPSELAGSSLRHDLRALLYCISPRTTEWRYRLGVRT